MPNKGVFQFVQKLDLLFTVKTFPLGLMKFVEMYKQIFNDCISEQTAILVVLLQ